MSIPPLKTLTPAIFVPIPASFPRDLPASTPTGSDNATKLRRSLVALDQHATQVKSNILALSQRECTRIVQEGEGYIAQRQQESGQNEPVRRVGGGMKPSSRAQMLACMTASSAKDPFRYTTEKFPVPDFGTMQVDNPVDWTRREVFSTVSRTLHEVKGFERHVARRRSLYENALQREETRYQRKRTADGEPEQG